LYQVINCSINLQSKCAQKAINSIKSMSSAASDQSIQVEPKLLIVLLVDNSALACGLWYLWLQDGSAVAKKPAATTLHLWSNHCTLTQTSQSIKPHNTIFKPQVKPEAEA
jgi:hypothetical protein